MAEPTRTRFPELYEQLLVGPMFRPWAGALLDRVPLSPTTRLLDIACGTGIVARLARERIGESAHIVGVDRSPGMLAMAHRVEPAIDWREGDSAELPLRPDERFDVVTCHQGLQFFSNKLDAMRAMRRALSPDGRIAIAVWRPIEENGLFAELGRIAERFVGPIDDTRFAFGDRAALERLLIDAGFSDVHVEAASREVRFDVEADALARINAAGVVGMSARGGQASDGERAALIGALVAASVANVNAHRVEGEIVFSTSSNIAMGVAS